MTIFANRCFDRLTRVSAAVATCVLGLELLGCAAPAAPSASAPPASSASTAPSALGPALRCMDGLLLDHGIRDLSVIIDPIPGADKESQSIANGYLAATFSDMTQRSRAIRLVMPGPSAERGPSANALQYLLRANLARNAGVTPEGKLQGLELTLLNTQDMSVVPGTGRHNEISVRAGPAGFTKFGQAFSVAAATTPAGATRALVEMSAIEMVGRLTRLPYWTCFGVDDSNPAVSAEIQDWYDALAARPTEIISFFQQALRRRGLYEGPVDGNLNADFRDAVARSQEVLGQPRESKLSLEFFTAWLSADSDTLAQARRPAGAALATAPAAAPATASPVTRPATTAPGTATVTAPPAAPAAAPAAASAAQPLSLRVTAGNDARRFAGGESVNLSIRPSREAHVYCFLQDEKRQILRFFPNRFQPDSRVAPSGLQLPGAGQLQLVMNRLGVAETVACFATDREVLADLPAGLNRSDLTPLPATSLDEVRAAFIKVSAGVLGHEIFELNPR